VAVSGAVSQKRYAEDEEDPTAGESRVTPVMAAPKWLRDFDSAAPDPNENQFWDAPPRDSATNLVSLAPSPLEPLEHTASRWNTWSARLLFATIACGVVALLGLGLR
jgi:hypothetical protein